jgi:hypothetical protein
MPNLGPGLPYATPWRRYQKPFTRLKLGEGIKAEASVGPWDHPSGHAAMDVFVNDDAFCTFASPIESYRFVMTNDSGGDFVGASNNHFKMNRYWIDGVQGTSIGPRKMRLQKPVNDNNLTGKSVINVATPEAESVYFKKRDTVNRLGNKTELITIEPGLHISFCTNDFYAYADDDYYHFELDYDYIRQLPKVYNGAWTCWIYVPGEAGDFTYTQDLPSELNLRPFSVHINPVRYGPKQDFTNITAGAKDFGLTTYLISKPKGEDWLGEHDIAHILGSTTSNETVKAITLDTDFSIGDSTDMHATMHHSVDNAGAERQQDLRLEITFPDTTIGPATMYRGQYIQVVIIPS